MANAADACPSTPLGVIINSQGCSGFQWVALACQPESFPNHGQYVSCVAQTAKDAVAAGLLTAQERARIVAQVAGGK